MSAGRVLAGAPDRIEPQTRILTFTVVYIKAPSGHKPQSQLLLRDLVELVVLAQDVDRAARRGGASLLALAPVVVHLVHLRSCAENVRGRGL